MSDVLESFPLFPLPLVMLPSEVVPLHIFEDRYRQMIDGCLEGETEFGIVWLSDDGLKEIGCSAQVTQLIERTDDGRMNILVRGTQPFRLLRRVEHLAYPAGDVEFLDEQEGEVDPEAADEARERYADLVGRVSSNRPDPGDLSELDAYAMAATIDFAPDAKQPLLELRSEDDRLRLAAELFESTLKRLDELEAAGERAKSNGKVHF